LNVLVRFVGRDPEALMIRKEEMLYEASRKRSVARRIRDQAKAIAHDSLRATAIKQNLRRSPSNRTGRCASLR